MQDYKITITKSIGHKTKYGTIEEKNNLIFINLFLNRELEIKFLGTQILEGNRNLENEECGLNVGQNVNEIICIPASHNALF